ncbi:MFS transporter [Pelomyxa schiedti]|nr:MFS transporter [Pelomyxa schiedti]
MGLDSSAIGTIVVSALVIVIVAAACVLDLLHNTEHHPPAFIKRRFVNWFLVGLTYASTYFGRYNMNVANQQGTYDILQVTSGQFGSIITVGFVSYAIFVVINGFTVDIIGARISLVIGAYGSAVFNVAMGLFAKYNTMTGGTTIVIISCLYACNNFFQTFCTSAICKVGVNWYRKTERGYFSGIFGVVISLGFFFAFQVCGVIYMYMDWCWIFFFPAMQLAVFATINIFVTKNTPADAGFPQVEITPKEPTENQPLLLNKDEEAKTTGAKAKLHQVMKLFKTVFMQPIFILLCLVDVCLGWCRDGVLSWYTEVLKGRFLCDSSSNQYSLASGGTTIGGMFGSLSAGILSDSFLFKSKRPPVAFLYFCLLTATYLGMVWINGSWAFASLVAIASMWLSGLNGLITSTCAMDFAGSAATGTAVGLLDGVQKIGSSLTGSLMGLILDVQSANVTSSSSISAAVSDNSLFSLLSSVSSAISSSVAAFVAISQENYKHWVESMIPTAVFAGLILLVLTIWPDFLKKKIEPVKGVTSECCVDHEAQKGTH